MSVANSCKQLKAVDSTRGLAAFQGSASADSLGHVLVIICLSNLKKYHAQHVAFYSHRLVARASAVHADRQCVLRLRSHTRQLYDAVVTKSWCHLAFHL